MKNRTKATSELTTLLQMIDPNAPYDLRTSILAKIKAQTAHLLKDKNIPYSGRTRAREIDVSACHLLRLDNTPCSPAYTNTMKVTQFSNLLEIIEIVARLDASDKLSPSRKRDA